MTATRIVKPFRTTEDWHEWLAENHSNSTDLWLKLAKKDSGVKSINYAQALDVALCWGWIDGQKDKFDEVWWIQRFCPRTAKSGWSKINRDKAEALIASGLMKPSGLKEVERAKADGRWAAAYDSQSKATVPDDLAAALAENAKAAKAFEGLNSVNRYAILYRTQLPGKPETRAARINKFVEMLARGETPHPQTEPRRATAKKSAGR